ncbi:pantoate kinase [Halobaculum sp. MBLA0147]|uniref:pantoate kinase n=1 Tax=Halobaculum sp. MBLA0147 TaxID=3079934 RepID=UPI0035267C14
MVPAHVTAFFAPHRTDEPATSGATGAGLALADGIETTVEPLAEDSGAAEASGTADGGGGGGGGDTDDEDDHDDSPTTPHVVTLDGERATIEAVEHTLATLGVPRSRIRVRSAVPVASGFGVSGGAALGAAVAAARVYDLPRTVDELVAVAHAAEVRAGTGLGDVVGAAHGGVPLRLAPGDPDHGRVDGLPARPRVEYVSFGDRSTAAVLADDTTAVTAAGERALDRVRETPRLQTVLSAARTFAREADLLVPAVAEAVEAVRATGGEATMAMLGETVVATGTGLSDAGYDPTVTRVDPTGVRLRRR